MASSNWSTQTSLRIESTDGGGADEHPLFKSVFSLGRSAESDVVLDDARVSRHHLRLELVQGGWVVTDTRSSGGVQVNGQRIPSEVPTPIRVGDRVDVPGFRLILRSDDRGLPAVADKVRMSSRPQPGLIVQMENARLKFALTKASTTLGRSVDSEIVISNSQISRHHAVANLEGSTCTIVDLGSTNGLLIGGVRVDSARLADGQSVSVGAAGPTITFTMKVGLVAAEGSKPVPVPIREAAVGVAAGTGMQPQPPSQQDGFLLSLQGLEKITIGRDPANDIVLDHPMVSRHHALLERLGGRYRIRDLKSQNGVFVGGQRIDKEAWLHEKDTVVIGGVELVLHEDGIEQFSGDGLRLDALQLNKWVTKDKNLLQQISLSIYPQEFVALVGMSGSGKSTLMDSLNGFRPATHGRVSLNGVDLYHNFDMFRNEMGYVPQKDVVHQELTVYTALDYAAQLRMPADTTNEERHNRITEVLRDLDLTERKDLPISRLSGGQLKRVSIGVELLTKPRMFFLDEPTSGLDPGTEFEMMKLLRRLADQGRTIVLITHATKNVMMCDRVIFLARGGYLAYYGSPEEALPYFDAYRTPDERQLGDMEFDDIYLVLNDDKRGKGKDWDERYRKSKQYQENVVQRLSTQRAAATQQQPDGAVAPRVVAQRPVVGTMRQFSILTSRNLRIMFADKFGLALMLALAPLIGFMDFIWGNTLFDVKDGDASKIITMLFMSGLISILVGAMASVREIVKEVDIYKRERAINLKLTSYITSKISIGVGLSLYQAVVLLAFRYVLNLTNSGLGFSNIMLLLITLFLGTLSGYMFGLVISAAAPNQNVALLAVVVVLVPQFLFAGALLPLSLIPGGEYISVVASTRWAFFGMVNASDIGRDIIKDPCWQRYAYVDKSQQVSFAKITVADKEKWNCKCMGPDVFTQCYFPGIRDEEFYTAKSKAELARPKPVEPLKPTTLPTVTPYPTLTPYPTPTPLPTYTPLPRPSSQTQANMDDYDRRMREQGEQYRQAMLKQGDAYRVAREKQGKQYEDMRTQQGDDYRVRSEKQGNDYEKAMKDYADSRESWQTETEKAIGSAENYIKTIVDNYGGAFGGGIFERWLPMLAIVGVLFPALIMLQKRKDSV